MLNRSRARRDRIEKLLVLVLKSPDLPILFCEEHPPNPQESSNHSPNKRGDDRHLWTAEAYVHRLRISRLRVIMLTLVLLDLQRSFHPLR